MKPPIRILIVEDHFLARIALHGVLDAQPGFQIVAETGVGEDAIRLYREHRPDVVIMDLKLIGVSGFDAIEAIRREHAAARILVLSNFQGSEDVYRAMRSGARGYLTKDADGGQVVEAIRTVAAGGRFIPRSLESRLAQRCPGADITARKRPCASTSATCWRNWAPATAPTRSSSPSTAASSTSIRIFGALRPFLAR
jgi:DNA-binding NarL/FixJ family response regulator